MPEAALSDVAILGLATPFKQRLRGVVKVLGERKLRLNLLHSEVVDLTRVLLPSRDDLQENVQLVNGEYRARGSH